MLGLWLLGGQSASLPRLVLGSCMLLYGFWGAWGGTLALKKTAPLDIVVGVLTGTVNGLTGSQIMPIMPYLMSLDITKEELIQAINTSFTLASLVMLLGLGKLGLISVNIMLISAVGTIPVFLGIHTGTRFRKHLPESVFRRIVFILIGLLGLGLILRSCL